MTQKILVICAVFHFLIVNATATPAKPSFWKNTPLDGTIEEMRSLCNEENDPLSCMKYKVVNFIDTLLKKDNFMISDGIEVRHNGYSRALETGRSDTDTIDAVENYIQSHDVTFNVPLVDAKVTVSPRNINDEELNLKIKFSNEARSIVESRKSKLKKIAIPIMVFVLLKAMTLIPLALGVLGLKAWNALQLSFFSFVISVALAIFQLCKKIATDNHHPHITHAPWEARSIVNQPEVLEVAQNLAYKAYA